MTVAPGPGPRRTSRRALLAGAGGLAAGAAAGSAWALSRSPDPAPSEIIPPDDDLMREHGVLKRVLLCYRELISRVQSGAQLPTQPAHDAALIIHDYIEGFHEGLEEAYVFPRLHRIGQLEGTVTTLLVQHARGRVLTQRILAETTGKTLSSASTRADLAAAMQSFVRMYEPHEAREDTVVFPAFRNVMSAAELADLARHFAELEQQQFGTDEFTDMVRRVAGIEQTLGIYDLAQFTPRV
jgi:hemerythrin-like domain-containing protein